MAVDPGGCGPGESAMALQELGFLPTLVEQIWSTEGIISASPAISHPL